MIEVVYKGKRMKILISNDDGIVASGIRALIEALAVENEVYVIAPDRERSAAGHSLTLHTPIRVGELEPKLGAKRNWVTTGTPGDCVKLGLNGILSEEEKPDVVITGINHGPNLGADIFYSGTVSCAMEGAILGYPAIAMSLASLNYEPENFVLAANFIAKFLPKIMKVALPERTLLNINVPVLDPEDIAGIAVTELGTRMFTDEYERRIDPRGKVYYWMAGQLIKVDQHDGTDINAIMNNMISITPLTFDITSHNIMPKLRKEMCNQDICSLFEK